MILLSSCYKDSVYVDQLDVTLTQYEPEFNYSSYSSFWMPDSVILKTNYMTDSEIDDFYSSLGARPDCLGRATAHAGVAPARAFFGHDVISRKLLALLRRAPLLQDVGFVLLAEKPQGGKNRIRRGFAEVAKGAQLNVFGQAFEVGHRQAAVAAERQVQCRERIEDKDQHIRPAMRLLPRQAMGARQRQ